MIDDIMGTEFDFCKTAIIGKKMNELAESRGLRLPFDAVTKLVHEGSSGFRVWGIGAAGFCRFHKVGSLGFIGVQGLGYRGCRF
jgi:hypothetical protein